MLPHKMFILKALRRRSGLRIQHLSDKIHLCDFLQHNRIMYSFCSILSPGEGAVILAKDSGNMEGIHSLKGLNNHISRISLIPFLYFLGR